MSGLAEAQSVIQNAAGTGVSIVVEDFAIGTVTGRVESCDEHGYAIFDSTPTSPIKTGRYLLWSNLTYATDPMDPTPDRCGFCGRDDVEFEDGLRCKVCAEAQDPAEIQEVC